MRCFQLSDFFNMLQERLILLLGFTEQASNCLLQLRSSLSVFHLRSRKENSRKERSRMT
eukprot:m.956945 g.956945  ORF g.956945 m.956945 type:complete len:59 (-) comp381598_c0_seq1:25-201(-)